MSNENISQHVYGTPKFEHVSGIQVNLDLCGSGTLILVSGSVVEPEPSQRAEEPKLNCLPEPEPQLRIAAPAPFYYPDLKKFYRKEHGY
jgi:hypothetical protein